MQSCARCLSRAGGILTHATPAPDARVAQLSEELGLHPVAARVLLRRAGGDDRVARALMADPMEALASPQDLPGAAAALARIEDACRRHERVVIHGDYDVDGICATVLLTEELHRAGARVSFHIPQRTDEGYGLGMAALRATVRAGAHLAIAVDTGSQALAEARWCREEGLDLVVLDHHLPAPEPLPTPYHVNPHLARGEPLPLSAVGVAWAALRPLVEPRGLDLCALGLVADVMPLVGPARAMVRLGLAAMAREARPGIRALWEVAGMDGAPRAEDIAFRLAPRLNAAGRVASARLAAELLLSRSWERAQEIARRLDENNRERQRLEAQVLSEAMERIEAGDPAIVLWDARWPRGVLGIVAARLVESHARPVFLAEVDPRGQAVGSGRTPAGFDCKALLDGAADLLLRHGGHAAAAGFTVPAERLEALRERIVGLAAHTQPAPGASEAPDATVRVGEIDERLLADLERVGPFGHGFAPPRLRVEAATVVRAGPMGGRGEHQRWLLQDFTGGIEAVRFRTADPPPPAGSRIDLEGCPERQPVRWGGGARLRVTLADASRYEELERALAELGAAELDLAPGRRPLAPDPRHRWVEVDDPVAAVREHPGPGGVAVSPPGAACALVRRLGAPFAPPAWTQAGAIPVGPAPPPEREICALAVPGPPVAAGGFEAWLDALEPGGVVLLPRERRRWPATAAAILERELPGVDALRRMYLALAAGDPLEAPGGAFARRVFAELGLLDAAGRPLPAPPRVQLGSSASFRASQEVRAWALAAAELLAAERIAALGA